MLCLHPWAFPYGLIHRLLSQRRSRSRGASEISRFRGQGNLPQPQTMSTVQDSSARLFWLIVLSAVLPPVAVALEFGLFTCDFLWNLLLSVLLPFCGFIHAAYLLTKARYERTDRSGYEQVNDAECAECQSAQVELPADAPINHSAEEIEQRIDPPPYRPSTHASLDNKIQSSY